MSLLQQDSSPQDDAARGEELTKGTSPIVLASILAAVVVTIAVALYIFLGEKPPAASGEVTRCVAHLIHRETQEYDAAGAPMPKEEFDQVLLFAHVRLHNQSKLPLFLSQITGNVTLADGIHSSYAASPTDYDRLFMVNPELSGLRAKSLKVEETIPAGEWLEGDFVTSFRMTRAEWEARKGLDYSVSFRYQPNLVLAPKQVTEQ